MAGNQPPAPVGDGSLRLHYLRGDLASCQVTFSGSVEGWLPVRDEVLAEIRALNALVLRTGDAEPVLDSDALLAATALLALVAGPAREPGQAADIEVLHAVGWMYWLRAGELPADKEDEEVGIAFYLLGPVFAADPEAVPYELRGVYEQVKPPPADNGFPVGRHDPDLCLEQAEILHEWYERSGHVEALQATARVCRTALAAMSDRHPSRRRCLSNLLSVLDDLAERTGDEAPLREAADIARAAVDATPDGHPDRSRYLASLWGILYALGERTGDEAPLREAADVARAAVAATPDGHPVQAGYFSCLNVTLLAFFHRTGDMDGLRQAVAAGRSSVAVASDGDPDWAAYSGELSNTLVSYFKQTGDLDALREAIARGSGALAATTDDDPDRVARLSNLGDALQALFEHTGDAGALREAVGVGRAAVAAAPRDFPQYAGLLSNLGNFLRGWFRQTGDLEALREAADYGRAAMAAFPEDVYPLASLATTLQTLFEHTGDLDALREAVDSGRAAADATLGSRPIRASILANLGVSLRTLSEETGDLEVLREAVAAHRESAAATPSSHTARAGRLTNLGNTLRTLSGRTGDMSLLRESVTAGRAALTAVPDGHPSRADCAANLTIALFILGSDTGNADALREAAGLCRAAVSATPDGHPNLPNYLSTLAHNELALSHLIGDPRALSEAITSGRAAVAASHEGHPGLAGFQAILGQALLGSARQTGNREDLAQARAVLAEAARSTTAPVGDRIVAGRLQSEADTEAGEHLSALAAMEGVVSLLPLAAPRELRRADREYQLGGIQGIAGLAAAAALGAGRPERAVELLEQARGFLFAETIDARSEQDRLQALAPDLADQFTRLRDRLARLQNPPAGEAGVPPGGQDAGRRAREANTRRLADQRRETAAQWDALLTAIRARPGLTGFLTPPAVGDLRRQADDGPVIFVTTGHNRSDALILAAGQHPAVRHVPLPGLTPGAVAEQANRFLAARVAAFSAGQADRHSARADLREILGWLWDTTTAPILAALGHSSSPAPGQAWPRVWWCPVGVLAYLPLHAAGHHGDSTDGGTPPRTVLDRVVSSYTSTVRALGYARQESRSRPAANRALIVAMPDTPGAASLPGLEQEARHLASLLPGATVLLGPDATHAAVLAALPQHSLAHFSCHGISDLNDPDSSHLLLHDHATRPLDITAISRLHLNADLAFLSACSTTQTSQRLVDEAVHITAAFQLAGYRNVIGTLWPVYEHAAALIASDVYADLTRERAQLPDTRGTALALHQAVRRLRADHPDDPAVWAAYIHTGT